VTVQFHENHIYKKKKKKNKNKRATLSAAEAEYISLAECVMQGMWFRNLFKEMINKDIKLKIMQDNKTFNCNSSIYLKIQILMVDASTLILNTYLFKKTL